MFLTAQEVRRKRVVPSKKSRRFQLEALEPRRLLATYAVTTLADTGPGSIRDAITQANAAPGRDEVVFQGDATDGTIDLLIGQLSITDALTIVGPGADRLTIDAQGSAANPRRAFYIDDGNADIDSAAMISGLTITGGFVSGNEDQPARGGGIFSNESLAIADSVVSGNTADSQDDARGGGIWAHHLSITNSQLSSNLAIGNPNDGGSAVGGGAFVAPVGTMSLTGTQVLDNVAMAGTARGGGVSAFRLEIRASSVSGNTAMADVSRARGGGAYTRYGLIYDSSFAGNSAVGAREALGGAVAGREKLVVYNSVIAGNLADGEAANGGGMYFRSSSLILDSTIRDNVAKGGIASRGGGMFLQDSVPDHKITNSTITGNRVEGPWASGGGVFGSDARVYRSMISSNHANGTLYAKGGGTRGANVSYSTVTNNTASAPYAYGGGLYAAGAFYSTIFNNRATGDVGAGGGIWGSRLLNATVSGNSASTIGGGVYVPGYDDFSFLESSTITNNDAPDGAGVALGARYEPRTVLMSSMIISANRDNDDLHLVDTGEFVSEGFNLVGGGNALSSISDPTDLPGVTDPGLLPLAHNGGPTMTHALIPTSPAINAGDPDIRFHIWADQRGTPFVREFGRADIGAFELQPLPGDFDLDGDYDCDDIDMLVAFLANGVGDPEIFGDFTLDMWLSRAGEENLGSGQRYQFGDANLDGLVDGQDFLVWFNNKFTETAAWCAGDFNADGFVDGSDFIIWNGNKFLGDAAAINRQPIQSDVVGRARKTIPSLESDPPQRAYRPPPLPSVPLVTSEPSRHADPPADKPAAIRTVFESQIDIVFARFSSL